MKKITINPYQIGLVFKKGAYQRMLAECKHWLGFNEEVTVYGLTKPFVPPCELDILLQDAALADALLPRPHVRWTGQVSSASRGAGQPGCARPSPASRGGGGSGGCPCL